MTLAVRWQEVVSKRDMMHSLNVQVNHELCTLHFALRTTGSIKRLGKLETSLKINDSDNVFLTYKRGTMHREKGKFFYDFPVQVIGFPIFSWNF